MREYLYEVKLSDENEPVILKIKIKKWEEKDGLPPDARRGGISHVAYVTDEDGRYLSAPGIAVPIRFYGRASEGLNAVVEAKTQAEEYLRKNSKNLKPINSS